MCPGSTSLLLPDQDTHGVVNINKTAVALEVVVIPIVVEVIVQVRNQSKVSWDISCAHFAIIWL